MFGNIFNEACNKTKNLFINFLLLLSDYPLLMIILCGLGLPYTLLRLGWGLYVVPLPYIILTLTSAESHLENYLNDNYILANHYIENNDQNGLSGYLARVQRIIPDTLEKKSKNAVLQALAVKNTDMVKFMMEEQRIFDFQQQLGDIFNEFIGQMIAIAAAKNDLTTVKYLLDDIGYLFVPNSNFPIIDAIRSPIDNSIIIKHLFSAREAQKITDKLDLSNESGLIAADFTTKENAIIPHLAKLPNDLIDAINFSIEQRFNRSLPITAKITETMGLPASNARHINSFLVPNNSYSQDMERDNVRQKRPKIIN